MSSTGTARDGPGMAHRVPKIVLGAAVMHLVIALTLMPVAGQPYDLAVLTGASEAWLRWGVPIFAHWKFGSDVTALALGAHGLGFLLRHAGMSGAAAITFAWKVPLVLADLVTAALLLDIGWRVGARRPEWVAALFLVSPVSLWVAAGHGQLEPLTILACVLSLDLLLRRRYLLAGVVLGLGVGIEYLPLLIGGVVLLGVLRGRLRLPDVLSFLSGFLASVLVCFGPVLLSGVGRHSLLGGISSTAQVASHPTAGGRPAAVDPSIWALLHVSPGGLWLIVAAAGMAGTLVLLSRRDSDGGRRRSDEAAMVVTGAVFLLLVTLLDPGLLPQFADLVLAGLCLLALCVDLSPIVIVLGPAIELLRGFFAAPLGHFQAYWYDMWFQTRESGWSFPASISLASWASRIGVLIVLVGLAIPALRRGVAHRSLGMLPRAALATGLAGSLFLGVWSLQPAYWQGVGNRGPAMLADYPWTVDSHHGVVSHGSRGAVVTFPPWLYGAVEQARVRPALSLIVQSKSLFARTAANRVVTIPPGSARVDPARAAVPLPDWAHRRHQVASLWVSFLFASPPRGVQHPQGEVRAPVLVAPRLALRSSSVEWVGTNRAVVTYIYPKADIPRDGVLVFRLVQARARLTMTSWLAGRRWGWLVVSMRTGVVRAAVGAVVRSSPIYVPAPGENSWDHHRVVAYVTHLPLRHAVSHARVWLGGTRAAVTQGFATWPAGTPDDATTGAFGLNLIGLLDVLLAAIGFVVCGRFALRAGKGPRPRHFNQSVGSDSLPSEENEQ